MKRSVAGEPLQLAAIAADDKELVAIALAALQKLQYNEDRWRPQRHRAHCDHDHQASS
jgi:hypothetical protein